MNTTIRVECLAIRANNDEQLVFFRVLNHDNQLAIANGVVVGT